MNWLVLPGAFIVDPFLENIALIGPMKNTLKIAISLRRPKPPI